MKALEHRINRLKAELAQSHVWLEHVQSLDPKQQQAFEIRLNLIVGLKFIGGSFMYGAMGVLVFNQVTTFCEYFGSPPDRAQIAGMAFVVALSKLYGLIRHA